jgi:hypothetical protein
VAPIAPTADPRRLSSPGDICFAGCCGCCGCCCGACGCSCCTRCGKRCCCARCGCCGWPNCCCGPRAPLPPVRAGHAAVQVHAVMQMRSKRRCCRVCSAAQPSQARVPGAFAQALAAPPRAPCAKQQQQPRTWVGTERLRLVRTQLEAKHGRPRSPTPLHTPTPAAQLGSGSRRRHRRRRRRRSARPRHPCRAQQAQASARRRPPACQTPSRRRLRPGPAAAGHQSRLLRHRHRQTARLVHAGNARTHTW